MHRSLLGKIFWILVLLVVLAGLSWWYGLVNLPLLLGVSPSEIHPAAPPILTSQEQKIITESKGASLLVSFTSRGFQPVSASVKVGDTVRFYNSAKIPMWIAATADSGTLYPGPGECGKSKFESCEVIQPQHFWEFTFTKTGTWSYTNSLVETPVAVIDVQKN